MKKIHWLQLAAAACGALIWIVVATVTGRREAWDSGLYFSLGMPAVCLVSLLFAVKAPVRPWRWGVLPMAGQFAWMMLSVGPGNLLPLGAIVFGVLAIPPILTARLGAAIARKS